MYNRAMKIGKIAVLRVFHGLFAVYFLICLGYLYYAGLFGRFDALFFVAIISLAIEGILVFVLNKGDCPLIHVQRRIGDSKPFFELFFPSRMAKKAIPVFAKLAWLALAILLVRLLVGLSNHHTG